MFNEFTKFEEMRKNVHTQLRKNIQCYEALNVFKNLEKKRSIMKNIYDANSLIIMMNSLSFFSPICEMLPEKNKRKIISQLHSAAIRVIS